MADAPTRFVRTLSAAEQADLERLRQQTPNPLAIRAEAVFLSARQVSIPEIMRRLGVPRARGRANRIGPKGEHHHDSGRV